MNYDELKAKWLWKKIDFDWVYWNQCVDFVKQAVKDLYWINIWTFNWSAYNWWNSWSPFSTRWKRVENTLNAIPPAWAVVFFDKIYRWQTCINPYWHVAITWKWCTKTKLIVLEQNAWNWNWDWKWNNSITERVLNYVKPSRCLWWYELIK